jgi:hypothetical protein
MTYKLTLTLTDGKFRIFDGITDNQKWDIIAGMGKGTDVFELVGTNGHSFAFPFRNVLFAQFQEN